jgi:hypothetical protein
MQEVRAFSVVLGVFSQGSKHYERNKSMVFSSLGSSSTASNTSDVTLFESHLRILSTVMVMLLGLTAALRGIHSGSGKRHREFREENFSNVIADIETLQQRSMRTAFDYR